MKKAIVPIIALAIVLIITIPLFLKTYKKDVSGTYQAADEESAEISILKQQAMTEYKSNNLQKAIEYYEKMLELRPDNAEIHNDLGVVYKKVGEKASGPMWPTWESDLTEMSMESAIDEIEFALSDTDSGYIVFKAEEQDVIDKTIELANKAGCWTHLEGGRINILKGKTMKTLLEARDHFKRAVIIKPNYATAYRNLGALYYRIGMRKAGIQMLERALDLNPSDQQLRTYLKQFK